MRRRVDVRIDELRLPAGTRGGIRALDAIRAEVARLLAHEEHAQHIDAPSAVARAIHDHIAPHISRPTPNRPPR